MTGYCPLSFFASLWTSTRKKEPRQYPAILTAHLVNNPYILTEQAWPIKDLIHRWLSGKFFLRDTVGRPERARPGSILPARVTNHSARIGSFPLTELPI